MENNEVLLSIFTAVEGAHAFSAFMPSYFTVQKFASDNGDVQLLRSGYLPAVLFNIVLGSLVTGITKKPNALIIAVLVSVFMIAMYEGAIGRLGKSNER